MTGRASRKRGQSLQDKVAVHHFRKSVTVKRPVGHYQRLRKLNRDDSE